MDIGHKIIDEIIKQGMFCVNYPDPDAAHVFVWSSGAAEQLHALVMDSSEVQIPTRAMALFSEALSRLGAPDHGDPAELLEWAEQAGKRLKANDQAERRAPGAGVASKETL